MYWEKDVGDGAARQEEKRRSVDVVREDMQVAGVTEEDAEARKRWKRMIRCGDPKREQPKEEEDLQKTLFF